MRNIVELQYLFYLILIGMAGFILKWLRELVQNGGHRMQHALLDRMNALETRFSSIQVLQTQLDQKIAASDETLRSYMARQNARAHRKKAAEDEEEEGEFDPDLLKALYSAMLAQQGQAIGENAQAGTPGVPASPPMPIRSW